MADSKKIKDIIDEQLNDFCVTEELKLKTLEKCKKSAYSPKVSLNKKLNIAIAAVLIFVMFAGTYLMSLVRTTKENKYASKLDVNNENTSNVVESNIQEKVKDYTDTRHDEYTMKNKEENKATKEKTIDNKKKIESNVNNKIKDKSNIKVEKENRKDEPIIKEKHIDSVKQQENISNENTKIKDNVQKDETSWEDKVKNVEKVWGGKVDFPAYVPEGYEVYDLVACNSTGKKSIRIIYKNEDSYFEVKQVKERPTRGNVFIKLNENNTKEEKEENKENKESTDLDATKNGIYYNVKGSVAKEILEKVMDSID